MFREQKRETSTMALSKAGLVKLNMKAQSLNSSSIKTTASTKLATTTRSSIPGFGIMAQRSQVGTGSIFSAKQYNSASISAQRHELNDNRLRVFNNLGGEYYMPMPDMGINKTNKFAEALAIIGTLAQVTGTAINTVNAVKAASAADKAGETSTILSNLSNAKTSGELQKGLDSLQTRVAECEAEIPKLDNKIESEKQLKEDTQSKLDTTTTNLEKENQNVTKQEGIITKLSSQISTLDGQISTLDGQITKAQAQNPPDLVAIRSLVTQKTELENQKTEAEKQKTEAEQSKSQSEANVKKLTEDKETYTNDLKKCDQNIEEYNSEKEKLEKEKTELTEASGKYQEKYNKLLQSETKELTNLSNDLNKLKEQFNKETKTDKKNSISEKYTSKAMEFNKLLGSTAVEGFTEVETNLSNV